MTVLMTVIIIVLLCFNMKPRKEHLKLVKAPASGKVYYILTQRREYLTADPDGNLMFTKKPFGKYSKWRFIGIGSKANFRLFKIINQGNNKVLCRKFKKVYTCKDSRSFVKPNSLIKIHWFIFSLQKGDIIIRGEPKANSYSLDRAKDGKASLKIVASPTQFYLAVD